MNQVNSSKDSHIKGMIAAIGCGCIWGVLPVYWSSLKPIDSYVIILYRVLLLAITAFIISLVTVGKDKLFEPFLKDKKTIFIHFIAGILISGNWSIYIWAVNSGFVIQTAMGYFIEPLIVAVFGVFIFKESINFPKKIALGFATLGLLVVIIGYGQVPIVAISLALTFAVYTAMKKTLSTKPFQALFYETIFLVPMVLVAIVYMEVKGIGGLAAGEPFRYGLLMLSGILTALPLGLFTFAASKLNLVTLGLTSYLPPTLSLILGIFLFNEPFDKVQFVAFILIWIGLIFFSYDEVRYTRVYEKEISKK